VSYRAAELEIKRLEHFPNAVLQQMNRGALSSGYSAGLTIYKPVWIEVGSSQNASFFDVARPLKARRNGN